MGEYLQYSNVHEEVANKVNKISVSEHDRDILRDLAKRWMEIAKSDEMKERKRLWKAFCIFYKI